MWLENKIFHEDLEYITNQEFIQWRRLQNKTVFITGGTGLIGFYVINSLLFYNRLYHANIRVVALVRNYAKARDQFKSQLNENPDMLTFVEGAIEDIPAVGMCSSWQERILSKAWCIFPVWKCTDRIVMKNR